MSCRGCPRRRCRSLSSGWLVSDCSTPPLSQPRHVEVERRDQLPSRGRDQLSRRVRRGSSRPGTPASAALDRVSRSARPRWTRLAVSGSPDKPSELAPGAPLTSAAGCSGKCRPVARSPGRPDRLDQPPSTSPSSRCLYGRGGCWAGHPAGRLMSERPDCDPAAR